MQPLIIRKHKYQYEEKKELKTGNIIRQLEKNKNKMVIKMGNQQKHNYSWQFK